MKSTSPSLFIGPIFEIVAGPAQKSFLVHPKILAKSPKFESLVNGEWKESTERRILLEDWDADTVSRLVEWLYAGDYNSPRPSPHIQEPAIQLVTLEIPSRREENPPSSPTTLFHPSPNPQDHTPHISQQDPIPRPPTPLADQRFHRPSFPIPSQPSNYESLRHWTLRQCAYPPSELDFSAAFLAHAEIYVLADYTLLPALQTLAFRYIRFYLTWLNGRIAHSPALPNLVTLIRYVYANTNRPNSGEEPLQELLSSFITVNIADFKDEEGERAVRELMEEGGDFVIDVWAKIGRSIEGWKDTTRMVKAYLAGMEEGKRQERGGKGGFRKGVGRFAGFFVGGR